MNAHREESIFELEPGNYTGPIYFDSNLYNKTLKAANNSLAAPNTTKIVTESGPCSIGIRPESYNIILQGISAQNHNPNGAIVDITGSAVRIENCSFHGDPIKGQHRGIAANGDSIKIIKTRIENCFLVNQDAQAICGWTGTRNLFIDGCYLEGGAQSVMIGGADPIDIFKIPTNIKITNSTLTKKRNWLVPSNTTDIPLSIKPQIKCALELKNCNNFYCFNCTLEYAGTGQGQDAFLIVLTPRNQSGKASFTNIQNVLIEHCTCRYGGGAVSFLGYDTNYPSGPLRNVIIRDTEFLELNHKKWGGSGRIFQFNKSPSNITLEDIHVAPELVDGRPVKLGANAYFIGVPPINLTFHRVRWPKTAYDLKIDNGGMGLEDLRKYCSSLVYEDVLYDIPAA